MKKTYRCRVHITPVNPKLDNLSKDDREAFEKALPWDRSRCFAFEAQLDENESPRTKALVGQFLKQCKFDNEKHFLFQARNVRVVKPKKNQPVAERVVQSLEWATTELLQQEIDRRRKALGLPEAFWPEEDEFSLKLHKSFMCPYCGGEDINAGEYDGDRELTCKVECGGCGARWVERYHFIGGWPIEEPDGEEENDDE